MKHWYWRNGAGWCYRFTRSPGRLAREAEAKRQAYVEKCAAEDREAEKRMRAQARRKVEAWQMPDDFFR